MKKNVLVAFWAALLTFVCVMPLKATPPLVIASVNEFTGGGNAPQYLSVSQKDGTFLGKTDVEQLLQYRAYQPVSDVAFGTYGFYTCMKGAADGHTYVAWLDSEDQWSYYDLPQLAAQSIAAKDNHVYIGGSLMGSDSKKYGIADLDVETDTFDVLAPNSWVKDIDLAGDFVYALDHDNVVSKYSLTTQQIVSSITLNLNGNTFDSIAIDQTGSIFASSTNTLYKFLGNGVLADSLVIDRNLASSIVDIDLDSTSGLIACGTRYSGNVVVTDVFLDSYTTFKATLGSANGDVYVGLLPVPEPTVVMGVFGGMGILLMLRKRRS